jgi:hypothetical protein
MEKFGAFRCNYPRKKSFEKAKDAWRRAIDRGADPDRMVEAAAAYARERAGEPAQYTPYPATWLDNGRYDDEPDPEPSGKPNPHSVKGAGHRPFEPPAAAVYQKKGF